MHSPLGDLLSDWVSSLSSARSIVAMACMAWDGDPSGTECRVSGVPRGVSRVAYRAQRGGQHDQCDEVECGAKELHVVDCVGWLMTFEMTLLSLRMVVYIAACAWADLMGGANYNCAYWRLCLTS